MNDRRILFGLLAGLAAVITWSAWFPHDWFTWWLEVAPGLAAIVILLATYRRFRFTTFCYVAVALHICILLVGGHYTYARVPLFDWLRPTFGWERNNFDRLGHFAQGFVPAVVAKELFVRLNVLNRKRWQPFLIVSVCLAISAFYELIEWWTASLSGDDAVSFLATQGDIWDTQKDMLTALVGAIIAVTVVRPWHDRAIASSSR